MICLLDINALAGQYAGRLAAVIGVFHAVLPADRIFNSYTETRPTPSPGFVFVIRGCGSITFNDTAYELHPGMIVHGGEQMSVSMQTEASELEYILVRYTLQDADETAGPPASLSVIREHFSLGPVVTPALRELLGQLSESFYTSGNMASIRTGYLFQMALHDVFSTCLNRQNGNNRDVIEQALAFIHTHYMDSLNLRKLAERHGLSPKSFSYLFHKYIGVSPIDYLIQHRMKRAQELLEMSSYSIRQIAASVGYEDALYFSRLYKKHYGTAPSQNRRK
jgi:AraC-like DNA-binding protein